MRIVQPTEDNIKVAARLLHEGVLIGMPTETVYGIAALARDVDAIRRTFAAKRRPMDNPLIVHVSAIVDLEDIGRTISDAAWALAERFWPGPLTVVVPRSSSMPAEISGGRDTVAVRMPNHPVAQALIRAAGPVTAPSANIFMGLSPTRADHIEPILGDELGMILDGGPCEFGVESTVVDCTTSSPRVLRPGAIGRARIEAALGMSLALPPGQQRLSPGMYSRHYSPRTPLFMVDVLSPDQPGITFDEPGNPTQVRLPLEPVAYAASLYAVLHRLDEGSHQAIFVERPPETPEWEAVWDRLRKASAGQ